MGAIISPLSLVMPVKYLQELLAHAKPSVNILLFHYCTMVIATHSFNKYYVLLRTRHCANTGDTEINKIDDEVTALWADSLQGETDSEKETL